MKTGRRFAPRKARARCGPDAGGAARRASRPIMGMLLSSQLGVFPHRRRDAGRGPQACRPTCAFEEWSPACAGGFAPAQRPENRSGLNSDFEAGLRGDDRSDPPGRDDRGRPHDLPERNRLSVVGSRTDRLLAGTAPLIASETKAGRVPAGRAVAPVCGVCDANHHRDGRCLVKHPAQASRLTAAQAWSAIGETFRPGSRVVYVPSLAQSCP